MPAPYSTPRGSAPISSQSPITADVVKFRCLYTHDVRRKSKRWQDGYLRYHAFNKRVMVYDESGNYIGDHHWRSTDEVQDGDELELDKGVLIEVGERMGTTQQDLTNLFEKRKSSQTSPPSNHSQARPTPTSTPAPLPVSTPSTSTIARTSGSQTFRSLNDLLGIKRTPIGYRPSPYEERNPQPPTPSLPDPSERAPKRPKVSTGTTSVQSRNVQSEVVDLTESEPQQPTRPPVLPAPREKTAPLKDARPNLSMPVEEPQPKSRSRPKEAPPIPNPSRQEPARNEHPKQDPPTFTRPSLHPPTETIARPKSIPVPPVEPPVESRAARPKPLNSYEPPHNDVPRNPRTSRPTPDTEHSAQPIKTLRMSTEKPRPKLMYSALLPSDTSQKSSPSSAMGPPAKRSQHTPKPKESQPASAPSQGPASTNMEFLPSVSTQSILEEMVVSAGIDNNQNRKSHVASLKGNQSEPARNLTIKRPLDAPFRKSLSDPTALSRSGLQARPTLMRNALGQVPEQLEEIEQGPWTSEALDLFDFWPPGRPKPC